MKGGVVYAQEQEPWAGRPPKVDWPYGAFTCCPGCSETLPPRARCRSTVNHLPTLTLEQLIESDACILDRADELARRRNLPNSEHVPNSPRPRRRWWHRERTSHAHDD